MSDALRLLFVASILMLLTYACFGYRLAYSISYGAFTLMAAMVSLTFLWLWSQRSTPLAMGMAFSWAGAASVMGWWWVFNLLDKPQLMKESLLLFIFLAFYLVGAVLHFSVIARSLGMARDAWSIPVAVSVGGSTLVHLIVR